MLLRWRVKLLYLSVTVRVPTVTLLSHFMALWSIYNSFAIHTPALQHFTLNTVTYVLFEHLLLLLVFIISLFSILLSFLYEQIPNNFFSYLFSLTTHSLPLTSNFLFSFLYEIITINTFFSCLFLLFISIVYFSLTPSFLLYFTYNLISINFILLLFLVIY